MPAPSARTKQGANRTTGISLTRDSAQHRPNRKHRSKASTFLTQQSDRLPPPPADRRCLPVVVRPDPAWNRRGQALPTKCRAARARQDSRASRAPAAAAAPRARVRTRATRPHRTGSSVARPRSKGCDVLRRTAVVTCCSARQLTVGRRPPRRPARASPAHGLTLGAPRAAPDLQRGRRNETMRA